MDALSFIAKFIGVTARVGATFALGALVIYALRRAGIEPFASLDVLTYQIVISAGVIGFCGVVVDLFIAFGKGVLWAGGETATTVRGVGIAESPQARSHEEPRSSSARVLRHAALFESKFLLEIDDANWTGLSVNTYYKVPDYVWEVIDRIDSNLPVPESPPWLVDQRL